MKTFKKLLLILLPLVIIIALYVKFVGIELPVSVQKKKDIAPEQQFCTIGKELYSIDDLSAFRNAKNYYPAKSNNDFFPGRKHDETLFIETMLYFNDAKKYKSHVHSGLEWEMKKTFFKGQMYARRSMKFNMGSTEKQLREYYEKNPNSFLLTNNEGVNTYGINKIQVADSLFMKKFPPFDNFYKMFPGADTAFIVGKWITRCKENYYNFFVETFYERKYGKKLPKVYGEIVGNGLPVSENEVEVVIGWLPENAREQAKAGQNKLKYAQFILAWKLFAEYAEEIGYFEEIDYDTEFAYFEKYTLVHYYMNSILPEKITSSIDIDMNNLKYLYWDKNGNPLESVDENSLDELRKEYQRELNIQAIYADIYNKRQKENITFKQSLYDDSGQKSPEYLFKKADSLRSSGLKEQGIKVFKDLTKYHLGNKYGRDALLELAKEANSKGEFHNAISKYREYVITSGKGGDFCDTYFMIAYIYGEELKKYNQAAANYKWIIKNAPECNMVDDAEFMCLHLGEPMPDVDELRDQAIRQGQSIK